MEEKRNVFDVVEEYEKALVKVELLPSVIQTYIERYNLENKELSDEELKCFAGSYTELYNLLYLVQSELWDLKDKVSQIASDSLKK